MDFRLLGPLEVECDGRVLALGGAHQRALLGLLIIRRNEVLSSERLIGELWDRPADARVVKRLHVGLSRLRHALGEQAAGSRLVTVGGGYRLRIAHGELDAGRFEQLVADGQASLEEGHPERAIATLEGALALWRGRPLADLEFESFAQPEIARLEELRLLALEMRVEASLAANRHREVIAELERLVAEHPLRERLRAQLMLALYRAGRHAHALESYQRARRALAAELGLEPGPELRRLEQAILVHDPALEATAVRPSPPGSIGAGAHVATAPASPRGAQPRGRRLPEPPTRLIGRQRERRAIAERLFQPGVRLVTLVGPGGVGKTRLALEVAATIKGAFADKACWVELGGVAAPEHVSATLARVLGAKPRAGETAAEALARELESRHLLLVIDNFEHVLPAAPLVAELLARCPLVSVLATSREGLDLAAEHRVEVPPLPVLDRRGDVTEDDLEQVGATALFLDAARRADDGFRVAGDAHAIAEICRRLDGIPLAIELAAARTRLLGPRELAERLGDALTILGPGPRDAPERQRTLRATIDWSYRLLDPQEQLAFARFAVFCGGATLDAAEAVTQTPSNILEGLLAKHLLGRRVDGHGRQRLVVLDTIRAFALERLARAAESDQVRAMHARHFLALAEQYDSEFRRTGSYELASRLDVDVENLRAALRWAIERSNSPIALRLAVALDGYWDLRDEREGARWLEAAFALGEEGVPPELRARARVCRAYLLAGPSTIDHADDAAREALALYEACGDLAGRADSLTAIAALTIRRHRRVEAFRTACEALALARRSGDPVRVARALTMKASSAPSLDAVLEAGEQAIERFRALGNVKAVTLAHTNLAYNAFVFGDYEQAQQHIDAGLRIVSATGDELELAAIRGNEGLVALFSGNHKRAELAFCGELEYVRDHGFDELLCEGLTGLAAVFTTRGRDAVAARLVGAIDALDITVFDDGTTQRLQAEFFDAARERIGATAWDRGRAAGAGLDREATIALALETARASASATPALTPR